MVTSQNHYEVAFKNWLADNRVQFVAVDQQKRRTFARNKIKSFDFILYPAGGAPVITEVKGRKFKGTSLEGLNGLDSWVTMEDVRGLMRWEDVFGTDSEEIRALFVFAYEFENIDVDVDGREVYDFDDRQYMFCVVWLDDYRKFMTQRSSKWQTVNLPAAKFRQIAAPVAALFCTGEWNSNYG